MSNGIHPLRPGANPYVQSSASAGVPQQAQRPAAPAQTPPAATARTEATPATRHAGLSADESAMIDALFPENGPTSLRLYGPGGTDRQVTPRAIGGRLDLSA